MLTPIVHCNISFVCFQLYEINEGGIDRGGESELSKMINIVLHIKI